MINKVIKTVVLLLVLTSIFIVGCEKHEITPTESTQQNTECNSDSNSSLKEGEEHDDEVIPIHIGDSLTDSSGNPLIAYVELTDSITNSLVDSTNTDSNGYYRFDNLYHGTYIITIYVNGNIYAILRVTI